MSGVPNTADLMFAGGTGGDPTLGMTLLGYALLTQALLAGICLLSWRRRVEQAWAPLFRPLEGVALALASVGCSALTLLDLSERVNTQSFDNLNLLTFLASAFPAADARLAARLEPASPGPRARRSPATARLAARSFASSSCWAPRSPSSPSRTTR